ncbi:quinoprotein dehydrogenase-associated putative ABC transporter substrate-binding protein [Coralloluteibacterium thermophilus]|uniref:Quinoprotein dehydrogenase-associated putative ABC transporter substrate-binding protein n=1 Tax=Coralloluteibacterium thermophilum TaxID=2707049 RepID=A0ABV9NEV3_9GAMM
MAAVAAVALAAGCAPAAGEEEAAGADDGAVLRVCADPGNMPLSNRAGEGFQNRIAEVLAESMGRRLEYHWHTYYQRGLARSTINAGRCDVLMDMSTDFEMGLVTRPVYRSTYVLVSGDMALKPESLDDPALKGIRLGVFQSSQARQALRDHGVRGTEVQYLFYDSSLQPEEHPAKLVEGVIEGRLDAAEAWGPTAGYYASRHGLTIHPLNTIDDEVLEYPVALAVARRNRALRDELDAALEASSERIRAILDEYAVPLVECEDCIVSGPLPSHGPYPEPAQTHFDPVAPAESLADLQRRLAAGSDRNEELQHALVGDDIGRIEFLLGQGADVDAVGPQGETALHLAVRGRQPAILARVLAEEPDLEARNRSGWTPLMLAVWSDQTDAVATLLAAGAGVDVAAGDGWSPLALAITYGDEDMVRQLIEAGADPNGTNPSGFTPVMFAVSRKQPELLEALVARGADVNRTNAAGITPLMLAAAVGEEALVRTLLEAGADRDAREGEGRTAAAIARGAGHEALAAEIEGPARP